MRASSELQFGVLQEVWQHARGREHCREEPGSALSVGWVRTRFDEGGGQLDRQQARGGLNPRARESKVRTGRFLREKLMSDYVLFSSYEGHKERRTGKICEAFQGCTGLCDEFTYRIVTYKDRK